MGVLGIFERAGSFGELYLRKRAKLFIVKILNMWQFLYLGRSNVFVLKSMSMNCGT